MQLTIDVKRHTFLIKNLTKMEKIIHHKKTRILIKKMNLKQIRKNHINRKMMKRIFLLELFYLARDFGRRC